MPLLWRNSLVAYQPPPVPENPPPPALRRASIARNAALIGEGSIGAGGLSIGTLPWNTRANVPTRRLPAPLSGVVSITFPKENELAPGFGLSNPKPNGIPSDVVASKKVQLP